MLNLFSKSYQVQDHSIDEAYMILEMVKIRMNKQYQLLAGLCLHSMRIT
jgi:hypothetical protein